MENWNCDGAWVWLTEWLFRPRIRGYRELSVMGRIFLENTMEFWRNPIILLTGGFVCALFEWISGWFRYIVREVIVAWMVVWLGIVFGTR